MVLRVMREPRNTVTLSRAFHGEGSEIQEF